VLHSDNSVTTRYFHTDNLGSIAVITDETGAVAERDSYDAWGKRRCLNGADNQSCIPASQTTTRGFTGQEELADVGLVHLNGRVYDPLVGRMMSADPMVPDPMNAQAWNRYSYVINNPLAFTDPNGYCFLGMCSWGKAISTFFNRSFGVLFREVPILGTLFEIAAVALCGPGAPACAVAAGFASTTFVAGVTSGNLGYALRAGLIAGVTAAAFYEVGNLTDAISGASIGSHTPPAFGSDAFAFNVAGHALVGCASAEASGGKCGPAALAGGVTSFAGPIINGPNFVANVVANSVLGGLASVAGGGKFANGAITGAFGYMFNSEGGRALSLFFRGIPGVGLVMDMLFAPPVGADGNLDVGAQIGILRDAAGGKGNFGLGSASALDSDRLGEAWVGPDYTVASDGNTLVSEDGLRQYRPPSFKPNLGITQSNFEMRFQPSGQWQSNGHLNITGP
jgi:RHS repeat-associated protein